MAWAPAVAQVGQALDSAVPVRSAMVCASSPPPRRRFQTGPRRWLARRGSQPDGAARRLAVQPAQPGDCAGCEWSWVCAVSSCSRRSVSSSCPLCACKIPAWLCSWLW